MEKRCVSNGGAFAGKELDSEDGCGNDWALMFTSFLCKCALMCVCVYCGPSKTVPTIARVDLSWRLGWRIISTVRRSTNNIRPRPDRSSHSLPSRKHSKVAKNELCL